MSTPPNPRGVAKFVTEDKDGVQHDADLTAMTGIGGKRKSRTVTLMDQELNLISAINGQALTLSAPGLSLQAAVNLAQGKYRVIILAVPEE